MNQSSHSEEGSSWPFRLVYAGIIGFGFWGAYHNFNQPNADRSANICFAGITDAAIIKALNAVQNDVRFALSGHEGILTVSGASIHPQTKVILTYKEDDGVRTLRAFRDSYPDGMPNSDEPISRPIDIHTGDFTAALFQVIHNAVFSVQPTD
jgi:hypothetical protein